MVSTATPTAPPSSREKAVSAVAMPTCCGGTEFCVATSPLGSCSPMESPSTIITSADAITECGGMNASATMASGAMIEPASCIGL
ncbi:hypothetical protein D3C85_1118100 [compost metagenome]